MGSEPTNSHRSSSNQWTDLKLKSSGMLKQIKDLISTALAISKSIDLSMNNCGSNLLVQVWTPNLVSIRTLLTSNDFIGGNVAHGVVYSRYYLVDNAIHCVLHSGLCYSVNSFDLLASDSPVCDSCWIAKLPGSSVDYSSQLQLVRRHLSNS